jgi:hypothetical protein
LRSRSARIVKEYFPHVILDEQGVLGDEQSCAKMLRCIPDEGSQLCSNLVIRGYTPSGKLTLSVCSSAIKRRIEEEWKTSSSSSRSDEKWKLLVSELRDAANDSSKKVFLTSRISLFSLNVSTL